MNENFYNSKTLRSANVSNDISKKPGNISNANYSHNQINTRQTLNQNPSGNHIPPNILPHLVNLISPQIPVSQSGNQALINMGFGATPFLKNQLYSIQNTFGGLNTISSPAYGTNNTSYVNNMHINHSQSSQAIMNFKDNKINHLHSDLNTRKFKFDTVMKNTQNPLKSSNYPVRLLINSGLVGPLIGRKGEKIKEITSNTGAKIDIKRESVPYSQFGLNTYMFSGLNRKPNGISDDQIVTSNNTARGESQIVFIVSDPDKCSAAITEIMQLCIQEAKEQGREEPNMGLLAEDRFCARLIGKDGRFLNWVRCKSGSQIHVSNVPTITTLSEQPHIISLDRIISCRGGGLASLLEAERLISDKIRQCVLEDEVQKPPCPRLAKDDSFLSQRVGDMGGMFGRLYSHPTHPVHPSHQQHPHPHAPIQEDLFVQRRPHSTVIGSGIVHNANPNWPNNLKIDENLYVRIPQICAGSIIGSEGKSVRRIMAETGTYIQISKSNLGSIESIPAVHTYRKQSIPEPWTKDDEELNERLITIKGTAQSQCSALTHIFSRVRICYSQASEDPLHSQQQQPVRLWVVLRVPKLILGRLIGKEGKVIRQMQLSSRTFLSFPRLKRLQSDEDIDCDLKPPSSEDIKSNEPGECGDQNKTKRNSSSSHTNEALYNPDLALFGDPDLHPVEIFGSYEAVEAAIYMIKRLVYSNIFSQFGPALIPGPAPVLPTTLQPSLQQLPPHTLLMQPMLMAAQRRITDCQSQGLGAAGTGSFFNNISHMHPAFMQQTIRNAPHVTKNHKKVVPSTQRSRSDHRSQSEIIVKTDFESYTDNKLIVNDVDNDSITFKGINDHNENVNNIENGQMIIGEKNCNNTCSNLLSPKHTVIGIHHESPPIVFPADLNPILTTVVSSSSSCSYFEEECCPPLPTYIDVSGSTADEDVYTAAHNSFVATLNDPSFPDDNLLIHHHHHNNNQPTQSPPLSSLSSLQSSPVCVAAPSLPLTLPPSPQQHTQSQHSFSQWSCSSNPPPF